MNKAYGRGSAARLLMAGAVVSAVLISSGCSPDGGDASASSKPSGSPSSTATRTPDEPSGGSVEVAPKLPDGTTIAEVANAKGNREVPLEGGVRKGPLGIMVACKGDGAVKVSFEPSGLAFPLKCMAGEVSTTFNQIDLKYDRSSAHIQVEAPASVSWAMSVGQS
ncbi:hypothetical protein ACFV2S_32810 [Streptomyces sp. NPDC059695]|uniref:hypothetical protein n=1 Tax=Streptomyces sp. NPDC059695 TaxID=3346910 RepID=UPI0036AF746F